MRAVAICLAAGFLGIGGVRAQTLLDGPLSVPNAAPASDLKATSGSKTISLKPGQKAKLAYPKPAHSKTARHATPPSIDAEAAGRQRDIPVARSATEDNPLSLGMKWNGSNDNASQTRVQNYGGDASGTGAAVGLKLHF